MSSSCFRDHLFIELKKGFFFVVGFGLCVGHLVGKCLGSMEEVFWMCLVPECPRAAKLNISRPLFGSIWGVPWVSLGERMSDTLYNAFIDGMFLDKGFWVVFYGCCSKMSGKCLGSV